MRSLLISLAAFVIGCAAQLHQRELLMDWLYMLFTGLAGIYTAVIAIKSVVKRECISAQISDKNRVFKALLLAICAFFLGFGVTGWRASAYQSQAIATELEGQDIRITGVLSHMPQRDESGLRFRVEVESAQMIQDGKGTAVDFPARIQLSWYRSLPRLSEDTAAVPFAELTAQGHPRAGERWQFIVRLKAPHGNLNPHGFDYELWLWEQGIGATGYVRASPREAARGDAPRKIADTWRHPIEAARQSARDAIFERVSNPQLAGVLAALVVGDQAAIDRVDWDIYRATGVAHLMSISGLHITMFAWGAALLVGALWRRSMRLTMALPAQHAALIGGVLLALLYALFAGWGLPAQRTVWMLLTVALLRLSGKRWPWPLVWLLALSLLTALDPWALLSAGFWLSFVAVGVLFASDAGRKFQLAKPTLAQRVLRTLREQWVITLALAPLSLLLFNQVSLVGLLANIVAIPVVTLLITPLALLGLLIAFTFQGAASRFDGRRALIVEEANTIGTAWLRIDLLPVTAQPAMRELFREYLDSRLQTYRKIPDMPAVEAELQNTARLQGEIWKGALAGQREGGQAVVVGVLPVLNQMFDIVTTRTMAAKTHPPAVMFAMLALLSGASAFMAGHGMSGSKTRSWVHCLGFAFILSIIVFVIMDMEYPRLGVIRVDSFDQVLVDLRQTMK